MCNRHHYCNTNKKKSFQRVFWFRIFSYRDFPLVFVPPCSIFPLRHLTSLFSFCCLHVFPPSLLHAFSKQFWSDLRKFRETTKKPWKDNERDSQFVPKVHLHIKNQLACSHGQLPLLPPTDNCPASRNTLLIVTLTCTQDLPVPHPKVFMDQTTLSLARTEATAKRGKSFHGESKGIPLHPKTHFIGDEPERQVLLLLLLSFALYVVHWHFLQQTCSVSNSHMPPIWPQAVNTKVFKMPFVTQTLLVCCRALCICAHRKKWLLHEV